LIQRITDFCCVRTTSLSQTTTATTTAAHDGSELFDDVPCPNAFGEIVGHTDHQGSFAVSTRPQYNDAGTQSILEVVHQPSHTTGIQILDQLSHDAHARYLELIRATGVSSLLRRELESQLVRRTLRCCSAIHELADALGQGVLLRTRSGRGSAAG